MPDSTSVLLLAVLIVLVRVYPGRDSRQLAQQLRNGLDGDRGDERTEQHPERGHLTETKVALEHGGESRGESQEERGPPTGRAARTEVDGEPGTPAHVL